MADRPELRLVHVTHFNELFWDCGATPATVIEHGVVDPGARWTGEIARAAVVVNEPLRRGRYVGTDLLPFFAEQSGLDVFGMGVHDIGARLGAPGIRGYEDLPQEQMHAALARRGVYLHPVRWTSLGLALIEAMHLGMPVVAVAATEAVTAIPPGAGIMSTSRQVLRDAVRRLLADPAEAAELGRGAREAALARYGLKPVPGRLGQAAGRHRVSGDRVTPRRPAVLVLRALGLGDFLAGVPAYRGLRAAYPRHELVLAAPGVLAPLAALTGAIDRVLPTAELAPVRWAGPPPQVAVDLHGSGPPSHRLVEALGAAAAMMYASPAAPDVDGPWWDDTEHEVARWCRLLWWRGIGADPAALRLAAPRPATTAAALARGAVVLHPGAASGSRRWPAGRFAAVARELADRGHRVVLTGSDGERPLADGIAAAAGLRPAAVFAGRTSLAELAGLIAGAALVISNDTGTAHLATAFGTPSVTLFGPVSPALWGPPPGSGRHIALWKGTGCRPGDSHGTRPDPRLLRISAAEVLDAAAAIIPGRSQPVPARIGQPT